MKKKTIKVGVKAPIAFKVPVAIERPETVAEVQQIARADSYLARCFNRGHEINLNADARELVRQFLVKHPKLSAEDLKKLPDFVELTKAVAARVKAFDTTKAPERSGRKAKPKVLKIKRGKKTYTPAEFSALLAAAGVKNVEFVAE